MNRAPVSVVALLACAAAAQSTAPPASNRGVDAQSVAGTTHRYIADLSPIAAARISVVPNPVKAGANVKIHIVLENRSDRDISLPPGAPFKPSFGLSGELTRRNLPLCPAD
jgi:hypothetical protein